MLMVLVGALCVWRCACRACLLRPPVCQHACTRLPACAARGEGRVTRLLLAPVPWQVIFDIHALQERFYFGDNIIPVLLVSSPLHNTHNTHNTHNKQRQHCCPLGLPCPCPNPLAHHCRTCLTLLLSSALHTHPQPLMRLTHKHPEHIGPSLRGRGGGHTHAHGQSGVPLLLTKLEELTLSMPYNPETPNVSAAKSGCASAAKTRARARARVAKAQSAPGPPTHHASPRLLLPPCTLSPACLGPQRCWAGRGTHKRLRVT